MRQCLLSGFFPSGIKTNYFMHISPLPRVPCFYHLVLLYLTTLITFVLDYKLRSSSLCSLLQPPTTSSLLGPSILLSTLCEHRQSMLLTYYESSSFTSVQTICRIMVLSIIIFKCLEKRLEDKRL